MISEARKRANEKWNEKNKEKMTILRMKATTKSFILNKASLEQIEEVKEWIRQREQNPEE